MLITCKNHILVSNTQPFIQTIENAIIKHLLFQVGGQANPADKTLIQQLGPKGSFAQTTSCTVLWLASGDNIHVKPVMQMMSKPATRLKE